MAGLEVNSVNAAQGANGAKEFKPQEEQKIATVPVGQGYGAASGGGQSEDVKLTNTYGKDFANFANFKGNDKNDAMRITTSAYNTVKKQYMQLQHEYPDVVLNFEPMPDPQKCGKKREGFFNYQQQLDVWKDTALQQINDAREKSTVEVVDEGVAAVNRNTNARAAEGMATTIAVGEAIIENDDENAAEINTKIGQEGAATRATVQKEGQKTRGAVHAEGRKTRAAVHAEGAATRAAVHEEGAATRDAVHYEGDETRRTVRQEGFRTRQVERGEAERIRRENHAENAETRQTVKNEGQKTRAKVQAEADRVIDTLDPVGIKRAVKGVRDMAVRAGKSVGEFISQNPNVLVPGLGIPLWSARKLISQM